MILHVRTEERHTAHVSGSPPTTMTAAAPISVRPIISDTYDGDYTVAAGEETQILRTNGLLMTDDLTIEPVPSNYGRLAWSGLGLRVY